MSVNYIKYIIEYKDISDILDNIRPVVNKISEVLDFL